MQVKVREKSSATLLANVVNPETGLPITADDVATITYKVLDTTSNEATGNGSIETTAITTDDDWNFRFTINGSVFPTGGDNYAVEVKFTTITGHTLYAQWLCYAEPLMTV